MCVWGKDRKNLRKTFPSFETPIAKKMVDFSRVQKELQECNRDINVSGISVNPKSDNLTNLIGTIPGPIGTPYEGGTFKIDINLPGNILNI